MEELLIYLWVQVPVDVTHNDSGLRLVSCQVNRKLNSALSIFKDKDRLHLLCTPKDIDRRKLFQRDFLNSFKFSDKFDELLDFQCPTCFKMFATRNAASRHRKEVHSELPESPEVEISRDQYY